MSASIRRYDLLRSRLDRFTRMLQDIEQAEPTAVHRVRVASRRLRELLPVLELKSSTASRLGRRLRKVTRSLGPLRELDVLLALVDELEAEGQHARQALRRVATYLRHEREREFEKFSGGKVHAELRRVGKKLERVARDLEDRSDKGRRNRAWRWAIEARVARRAETLRSAVAAAGAVYLHERLHEVRLALKKLRYAAELAADADGVKRSADLRGLRSVQQLLGRLHDLQVLIDRVRIVQTSLTASNSAVASRQLDSLVVALEHTCRRLHAKYVRERDSLVALCERLSGRTPLADRRAG